MTKTEKLFNEYKQPYLDAYKEANGKETTIEYRNGWVHVGESRMGDEVRVARLPEMTQNLLKRAYDNKHKLVEPTSYNVNITPTFIEVLDTIFDKKHILYIGKHILGFYYLNDSGKYLVHAYKFYDIFDSENEARKCLIEKAHEYIKTLEEIITKTQGIPNGYTLLN